MRADNASLSVRIDHKCTDIRSIPNMRRLAASLQFLSADCRGELVNNVPRAVLASSQFLGSGADFALHATHILCRSLTNTAIICRLLLKCMTNSRGPGGDTDNDTGAKFRINTSLIVRTSI